MGFHLALTLNSLGLRVGEEEGEGEGKREKKEKGKESALIVM